MKVFIERNGEIRKIRFSGSVKSLLSKLKINSEEVLVVKDGVLLTLEDTLHGNEDVRVLPVVSGG